MCVNIGSGNWLLSDGNKPLAEPMLTYHHRWSVAFTREQFYKKRPSTESQTCVQDYTFKIITISPRGRWVKHFLIRSCWRQVDISWDNGLALVRTGLNDSSPPNTCIWIINTCITCTAANIFYCKNNLINPLHAGFFRKHKRYLHFLSYCDIEMVQVVEILISCGKQDQFILHSECYTVKPVCNDHL